MTRASDSRVWDGDGSAYIDCTTQGGRDELVGRLCAREESTTLNAKSTCA